ncbi:MAG: hypothetical protein K2H35_06100 [Muribaculaceae bacterium]|nr:hypothetical protein [Muribaculaceae bacterium]
MFIQKSAGNETLFFIFSQKLPVCKCTEIKSKPISYDYTYVSSTDSISMLITLPLKSASRDISISISTDDTTHIYNPELIYVHSKGKFLEYRLRVNMSFEQFNTMYSSSVPFTVDVSTNSPTSESNLKYCFSDRKKWENNKSRMMQIIDLIKLNTGKI